MKEEHINRLGEWDYYVTHDVAKPKEDQAGYVEGQGFLVPRRFESLVAAQSSGLPFIIRSEHPGDVRGPSGLVDSYIVTAESVAKAAAFIQKKGVDPQFFLNGALTDVSITTHKSLLIFLASQQMDQEHYEQLLLEPDRWMIEQYCTYTDQSTEHYLDNVSWSYWEYIPGINRSIIADNVVPDRYHIFSNAPGNHGYTRVDADRMWQQGDPITGDSPEKIRTLIEYYEQLRQLPRFLNGLGELHAPIIEIQSVDDSHYFLQAHKTRDMQGKKDLFSIGRPMLPGEVDAMFVRGMTPPEGIEIDVDISLATGSPSKNPGIYGAMMNLSATEACIRNTSAFLISYESMPSLVYGMTSQHVKRSEVFKPEVFIGLRPGSFKTLLPDFEELAYDDNNQQRNASIRMRIVADGQNAYVQRM